MSPAPQRTTPSAASVPLDGVCWHWAGCPHDRPAAARAAPDVAAASVQLVKRGDRRAVYRLDLPGGAAFLKHQQPRGWRDVLRQWLGRGPGRREFDNALELARRRVPAVKPLAVGHRRQGFWAAESYLLTEAVPAAATLDDFLSRQLPLMPPRPRAAARRELTRALARLCAAAHRSGAFHDDLHAGNIVVAHGCPPAGPAHSIASPRRLLLADLPGVRFARWFNWPRSRANLAMLCGGLLDRSSRADRLRFWKAYLAARTDLALADPDLAAADVFARAQAHSRRVQRRRDKRPLAANRDFRAAEVPARRSRPPRATSTSSFRAYAVADLPDTVWQRLLSTPPQAWTDITAAALAALRGPAAFPAKTPAHCSACRPATPDPNFAIAADIVHAPPPASWISRVLDHFRPHPLIQAWTNAHALLARGIATPRPLALVITGRWPLRRDGLLLVEQASGAQPLAGYLANLAGTTPDHRRLRAGQVAASLGRLIGRMHAWHIDHSALPIGDLWIIERPATVDVVLAPTAAVRIRRRLSQAARRRRLTELAAWSTGLADIQRHAWFCFFRAYARQARLDRPARRALLSGLSRRLGARR